MGKTNCPYCGRFRGVGLHSCAAKRQVMTTSAVPKVGPWRKLINSVTGADRVAEGENPDIAANRHLRVNEGGAFSLSAGDVDLMHHAFQRRRLSPKVGHDALVRLYDGDRRGVVRTIVGNRIELEFPSKEPGEAPTRRWYSNDMVVGVFDPDDENSRPLRPPKDPNTLGIIKKNSRISVAFYDRDVAGTVIQVRGNIIDFMPDGGTRARQVDAAVCSLLPDEI